jgi:cytochrome c oxidase subunit 2
VTFNIVKTILGRNINKRLLESQSLELFWTVVPAIILLFIGFPSIRLLYLLDEVYYPSITLKTVGHQWYWSYEYSDFSNNVEFDSFMVPSNELSEQQFRLLDVDNRTVLPFNTQVRNLISSADVIHSWTIPSIGVKADAVPGRLNQVSFNINTPGVFYGQCSEICGANHRFMPIVIESTYIRFFKKWIQMFSYIEWPIKVMIF